MRRFAKWLGQLIILLVVAVGALWAFGPREPVDTTITFDPTSIGDDLDAWVAGREASVLNLRPGSERQIVWAGAPGDKTEWAVVYLHGFSAAPPEVRPLPDLLASGLGANLYFTRFAGHGRDGAAMAEPEVNDWFQDLAEAVAVGRRLGDKVMLVGLSNGSAIAASGLRLPGVLDGVDAMALMSPAFRLASPASVILTWPAVRWWGPIVAGPERSFDALSEAHARGWTTRYPTTAVFTLGALEQFARGADFSQAQIPALFLFDPADQVADHTETRKVAAAWGGPATVQEVDILGDPYHHIIAGDAVSPEMTPVILDILLNWARDL